MKKAKIFYGEPESGKSRKAREIAEGRNSLFLDVYKPNLRFQFQKVTKETDLIIIDNLPNGFNFDIFYNYISDDYFHYEVQRKGWQQIPTPEFIFITNRKPNFKGSSFERRFELIEF